MKGTNRYLLLISDKSGAVLMLVLWALVLLTIMVTEFAYSMKTEVTSTRNFKEGAEMYYAAMAALNLAKAEILDRNNNTYLDKSGRLVFGEKGPERSSIIGNTEYSYEIIDEDRKLNINSASSEQIRYVLKESGIEDSVLDMLVDSIMDWKDADNLLRLNGAEDEYYGSLTKPYSCKDDLFDSIDELILVNGFKPEMIYGSKDGKYRGLHRYMTARSSGMVNINTADWIVLESVFGPAAAANIIQQRTAGPIIIPIAGGIIRSGYFSIFASGGRGKIVRTIRAVVVKRNDTTLDVISWNDNWTGFDQYDHKKGSAGERVD
ncbi:MAG: type II secretion system protein GspK [Dissulfurispiraceae bacterium]|jgi:general secretion pathway protein K|nr:type II secretion system protein GspK [Dissulfurispiraceae bacterium]